MQIEIDIDDYLSEEDKRSIVYNCFQVACNKEINKNIDQFIINKGYEVAWKIIDEKIPDFTELIANKTLEVIVGLTSYSVFRKKDGICTKEDSLGQQILEQTVADNKHIVEKRVQSIMNELSETDLKWEIKNIIEEYIYNLFEKREENSVTE